MKFIKRLFLISFSFICSISVIAQNQNSLYFDGLNDKVDLSSATQNGILFNVTLEAWIKTSANNSGYRGIVVRSNYYGLFLIDNQLSTYNWGVGTPGATTYSTVSLNDGTWHHVALRIQLGVTNGTQMYLDGQPVGPAITLNTANFPPNNNFEIGCNTNTQFFDGQIDNVKIYNRALSASEINDSYNCLTVNSTELKGSYNFNQGIAAGNNAGITTLSDQSGNNNNGTLSNFSLNGSTSNWVDGKSCCFLSSNITGTTSYCQGQTMNLTASFVANSGESITGYQWKKNGVNLTNGGNVSGATSANLQIANLVSSDFDSYSVEVTSTCGVGINSVNITESGITCCFLSSNITGSTSYCQGQTINLTASFVLNSGESITGYQWKKNGVNLTNGGNISGATSANLQILNLVSSDFDTYSVEVTSTCGVDSYSINITESGIINISNLIAYYPFNNGSSADASGNNYNATATAITSVNNRFNQTNSAFSFNGTSSTVTIAAPTGQTILGNGQNKSISLWFKRSSLSSKGILIGYQQASPGNWNPLAYIGSDGILRGWMYQGGFAAWSSGIIIDTNWHHLALVYSTNTQTAYLDGSQVATMSGTPSPGASNIIQIGNGYANTGIEGISTTGNQPFSGLIDEVRFYNAVLSLSEINTLRTSPFLITTQPQNQSVCAGETANLSLSVLTPEVGSTFTYQWTFNGTLLTNGGSISGANTNNLQISNAQVSNAGTYNCIISSGCNEATSTSVTLTVDALNTSVTQSGITLTATQSGANYSWVDCNNGNQAIAGATAQTYTVTSNGSYAVIVEQNGCTVTSNCVEITTVGLEDIKTELFRVYPNPASTVINVEMTNASAVRLFDVSGKLLKELNGSSIYTIDVTDLTSGIYMIESAEGAKAKFIKK